MAKQWRNWSHHATATPTRIEQPTSTRQVYDVVQQAVADGHQVKAIGSGHSFGGIAVANNIQVDLSKLTGIVALDERRAQVTLHAGTRLWQIPKLLAPFGLALQNLGDINQQSIVGAIATATHGTGPTFGSLASQVVGLQMMTGTGQLLDVNAQQNPQLLDALRVHLGAFGVMTTVTLQLVPEYSLHTVERVTTFDEVVDRWDEFNTAGDHFEFFWFGHESRVHTKSSRRLEGVQQPARFSTAMRRLMFDDVLTNAGLGLACHLGRWRADWIPQLNRLCTSALGASENTSHWSAGFATARRVRFQEMEYAIPYEAVPEVMREVRRVFDSDKVTSTFPLEVRSGAAETSWLAPNFGRKTGFISVHQFAKQDFREYFSMLEPIFLAADGRPHWGKLHSLDAETLAPMYPKWSQIQHLRDQHDPDRLMSNTHLEKILGR